MAKSLRSKKQRRLRTLRRDIVEPFYDKKDDAKLAAQQAALAAPKVPVRGPSSAAADDDVMATEAVAAAPFSAMDVEMADGSSKAAPFLRPLGKKLKKRLKRRGKGKNKRKYKP